MKKAKIVFIVLFLLSIPLTLTAFFGFRRIFSNYSALKTLRQCSFTMEYRITEPEHEANSALQNAGIQYSKGFLKGQFCNGLLYAKIYQDKSENDLITEVFANKDDCIVNVEPIAKRLIDSINKINLPFPWMKDEKLYVSLHQIEKFFPNIVPISSVFPVSELDEKKMLTQFRRCNAPKNTVLPCDGYYFYEYSNEKILIGLKKLSQEEYSMFLYVPGKVESTIDYTYEDSPESIIFPEPSISDSVLKLLKYIF